MSDEPALGRLSAVTSAIQSIVVVLAVGLIAAAFFISRTSSDAYADARPGAPIRLVVPTLDARAPVVPIELAPDGVLDPPRDAVQVGWWDGSAKPGANRGQTVITGHTVHTGGGSMNRLRKLRSGDTVDVVTRAGRMRYQVSQVSVLTREEVADQAQVLFGQAHGGGRLVLVSCTAWDGSEYQENVIAQARPLGMVERDRAD